MPTEDQKRLWREEKEQQKRDKLDQPREVRRRAVDLKFGGVKKQKGQSATPPTMPGQLSDDLMKRTLGL